MCKVSTTNSPLWASASFSVRTFDDDRMVYLVLQQYMDYTQ